MEWIFQVPFGFEKNHGFCQRRFCSVFFIERVSCLSCVCILHFSRRFSNPRFYDHLLSNSVCNMKNVKAL